MVSVAVMLSSMVRMCWPRLRSLGEHYRRVNATRGQSQLVLAMGGEAGTPIRLNADWLLEAMGAS